MNRKTKPRIFAVLILAFIALALFLSGCKDFSFFSELGIKGGLNISPSEVTVTVDSSVTFTASGGNPPYTYAVASGTGSIDAATGVYTAPAAASNDIVVATDSSGQSGTATVLTFSAAAPNVDYIVDQVNFVAGGSTYLPDGPMNGNFLYKNNGTNNGTQPVSWEAYASLDTNLDAGDVLIESGSGLPQLAVGATSGSIAFFGKWPLDYGKYFLVVRVMSSDEFNPADNVGSTAATEAVGYFDESLFESNNDYVGLTDFYDPGVTFQPGMSIRIDGTMDAVDLDDIMAFNTGTCSMITFAVTYGSANAQIRIFLLDGPNNFIDGVSGTPGAIALNWTVDAAGAQRYLNLDNRGDNPAYTGSYTCVVTGH